MEIRHLEIFLEVSRCKSFSKAAEALHISQPPISKAIKELEHELGKILFYRSTKFVELTDAGAAILEQAQQIVASFRNLRAELEGLETLKTGRIHIGLPPITAVTSFAEALGLFQKQYPQIHIFIHEYGPKRIESLLKDGLLDFGIFTPENDELFGAFWFEKDPHWLLMRPDHPLAVGSAVSYSDLARQPLIIYTNEYKLHDQILSRCRQAGGMPEIKLETTQLEMMVQMVAADLGLALLPGKICQKIKDDQIVGRPFHDGELFLHLALTWMRNRYMSFAAKQFLHFFENYLAGRVTK